MSVSSHVRLILVFGLTACEATAPQSGDGSATPAWAVSGWDAFAERELLDVARGGRAACAVDTDGGLWCWGAVDEVVGGGPGSGDLRPHRLLGEVHIVDVQAGPNNFCALANDGILYCWGANYAGMLGVGGPHETHDPAYRFPTPTRVVVDDGVVFTKASMAFATTCAIDDTSALWCWGMDVQKDVWWDTRAPPNGHEVRPVLYDSLHVWESVAVNRYAVCGVVDGGHVRCVGHNAAGVLGDPGVPIDAVGETVLSMPEGASRVADLCALVSEEVWCWGYTAAGLSGDASRVAPVRVDFPRAVQDRALRAIGVTGYGAWHDSAEITIWGPVGEHSAHSSFVPPTTLAVDEPFSFMDGSKHACGIGAETGKLYCRGDSELLGPNYDTFQDEFVPVP